MTNLILLGMDDTSVLHITVTVILTDNYFQLLFAGEILLLYLHLYTIMIQSQFHFVL